MKTPSNKPTGSPPSTRRPLSEAELYPQYELLPDHEVVPCLLFEFLRESVTAQTLSRDLIEFASATIGFHDDARPLLKRVEQLKFDINYAVDAAGFIYLAVVPIPAWNFIGLLNSPWHKLLPVARQTLITCCTELKPAAYISDSNIHTDQLAETMRDAAIKDMEAEAATPASTKAIANVVLHGSYPGRMIFGVIADFARYDDNAIREAMAAVTNEILKHRPAGITPQVLKESGHGRIAEWRGTLNSLWLARVAGRFTAHELQQLQPKVYNLVAESLGRDKGLTAVQKKLNGAKNRFVARFHKTLPFERQPPLCLRQSGPTK